VKIALLGTGSVGRALAARLHELGHEVVVGTRDPAETMARTEPDAFGNQPYAAWAAEHADVPLARFAEATDGADLVVNATSGTVSLSALELAGVGALDGVVVLDTSNALDFSEGFPPRILSSDRESLAERLQAAFPNARIVKALSTMTASVMADPSSVGGGDHTVLVAGDDADARAVVTDLLTQVGHRDVVDLGDLSAARGMELYLPLWLRIMGSIGTAEFNIKIVR
jgi:predicted dinucleotide-binding enzyme